MFNFNFGKRPDKNQLIIVGIVLSTLITALSQCSKISENALWDLLDEIQREFFHKLSLMKLYLKILTK